MKIIIAAAAAIAAVATPAFAQPQGMFGQAKVTFNQKTNQYCLTETVTGSRIPQITCRSTADWASEGLTITRKPAVQLAQR